VATVAGVRSAVRGSPTAALVVTSGNFQPESRPCQFDLVPGASASIAVGGPIPATARLRPNHRHERPTQAADWSGPHRGDGLKPSLPGTARRKAAIHRQQRPPCLRLRRRRQDAKQGMDGVPMPYNPDHQGLPKQAIRRARRATVSPRRWGRRWDWYPTAAFDQRDKPRLVFYQRDGLRVSEGGVTTMRRR
jgi:hypothetical protein